MYEIIIKHNVSDLAVKSAYDYCIWEGWMPPVRRAILNWSPRDNGPAMMNFVEIWLPLLPLWITENLLDLVIFFFICQHLVYFCFRILFHELKVK